MCAETLEAVSWNLGAFLPELLAVANRATQEHHIEVALEHLTDIWGLLDKLIPSK